MTVSPLDTVSRAYTPAFFGHALNDSFVKAHHTRRLHEAYAGEKEIMLFNDKDGEICDHNSPRPDEFYDGVRAFLARAVQVPAELQNSASSLLAEARQLMPGTSPGVKRMHCCAAALLDPST
jgi:hypothetical protein